MKKLILCIPLILSACVHKLPVTSEFPTAPTELKEECPKLDVLKNGVTLSEVMITITLNYMKYHECKLKNKTWIEWYEKQKKIHEDATKK